MRQPSKIALLRQSFFDRCPPPKHNPPLLFSPRQAPLRPNHTKRPGGRFACLCRRREPLQVAPQVHRKLLLQPDQPLGDVLGLLIRRLVLVQVLVQGLDPHVAAVCHQLRDGGV